MSCLVIPNTLCVINFVILGYFLVILSFHKKAKYPKNLKYGFTPLKCGFFCCGYALQPVGSLCANALRSK